MNTVQMEDNRRVIHDMVENLHKSMKSGSLRFNVCRNTNGKISYRQEEKSESGEVTISAEYFYGDEERAKKKSKTCKCEGRGDNMDDVAESEPSEDENKEKAHLLLTQLSNDWSKEEDNNNEDKEDDKKDNKKGDKEEEESDDDVEREKEEDEEEEEEKTQLWCDSCGDYPCHTDTYGEYLLIFSRYASMFKGTGVDRLREDFKLGYQQLSQFRGDGNDSNIAINKKLPPCMIEQFEDFTQSLNT